jgi:hypothetical protein
VLAGVRYNRIESLAYDLAGPCTDCAVHPFAGFYAELLHPSRTSAFYGELSMSSFRSRGERGSYYSGYTPFDYQAWLGTARLGARFFAPLRHDQLLLFTFCLERNFILRTDVKPTTDDMGYAVTALLPNFGVGWRRQRITLNLDGQLYTSPAGNGYADLFFGSNIAVRLGLGYRLGRSADAPKAPHLAQP